MSVLVVEDEPLILDLLSEEVRYNFNQEVDCASDGEQAYNQCCSKKYNLILLDYKIPLLNGYKLVKKLKKENNINAETPIIVITAYANSDIESLRDNHSLKIISKPFNFDHLKNEIESTFNDYNIAL